MHGKLRAQQEGNFLFFEGRLMLQLQPPDLVGLPSLGPQQVYYNDTFDFIDITNQAIHPDCDGAGIDHQISTIFTRSRAGAGYENAGIYADTSGRGFSLPFPDWTNDSLMHVLMPFRRKYPEFSMVQQLALVTYNRFTFDTLLVERLSDSVVFGMHQVIRHENRRDNWLVYFRAMGHNYYQPVVRLFDGQSLGLPVPHAPVYIHSFDPPVFTNCMLSPDETNITLNMQKGAFTLFKFDRSQGRLYDRLPVYPQSIYYRPLAGDLQLTAMQYSPSGQFLYLFTNDFRSIPFRQRFYQFDLSVWDSLAVTRGFIARDLQDTLISDFAAMPDGRVYFVHYEIINGNTAIGRIQQADSVLGVATLEFGYLPLPGFRTEIFGEYQFSVTRAHYNHPRRFRFSKTAACTGQPVTFSLNETRNLRHIQWEMGDGQLYQGDTLYDITHHYVQPGTYHITATATYCGQTLVMQDSVFIPRPPEDKLQDTTVCDGNSLVVQASQEEAATFGYRWSDGDSVASKVISQPGWWWVEVQGPCGQYRDSFYVSHNPRPLTLLPADTVVCAGQALLLQIQPGNYRWEWPDGSSGDSYTWSSGTGVLPVVVENHCGKFVDSIHIRELYAPAWTETDTVVCQSLPYLADFSWDAYTHIRWQDGDTNAVRSLTKAFDGYVAVDHPCFQQQLNVRIGRERCDCQLFLPTAFTPNGDGLNDVYMPVYDCSPQLFELTIFDRWGKVVFESAEPAQAWDGNINGLPAETGFYAVRVTLLGVASREIRQKGTSVYLSR